MSIPTLYRKRLIPNECVCLKDDEVLLCTEDIIVTKWKALKPKKDLSHGLSCFFLKEGFKISRFFDHSDNLMYHYIDIISSSYEESSDSLIVTDLLADIIVYPDGMVKVVDLDEITEALNEKLIDTSQVCVILNTVDKLLRTIYSGNIDSYCTYLNQY